MSVEAIGLATVAIGLFCLWRGSGAVSMAFVVATVLGSAAAVLIGQNNIQPAHLFLGFLAAAVLLRRDETAAAFKAISPPHPGFWLAWLVVYGVITGLLLPRLLAGVTEVVPLGVSEYGASRLTVPLGPNSSNLTQSIYLIADFLCFALIAGVASTRDGFRAVVAGMLFYAAANTLFALLDLATYLTGAQSLLDFIRNASYTMHHEEEVGGLKRIVGSFTEASVFGRSTLGVLGFTATMWLCGRYTAITGPLALASLALLTVSTSSTALAGLPVLLLCLYITAWQMALVRERLIPWAVVILFPLAALVAVTALLLNTEAVEAVTSYVDTTLLNKINTASGVERASWNSAAFQNLLDTWGLGVGLGTARSSNFLLALVSNTGVLGLILYSAFAYGAFLRPRGVPRDFSFDTFLAARNACLGMFIGDMLAGSVLDQGLLFYALAGLAAAVPVVARTPAAGAMLPHGATR